MIGEIEDDLRDGFRDQGAYERGVEEVVMLLSCSGLLDDFDSRRRWTRKGVGEVSERSGLGDMVLEVVRKVAKGGRGGTNKKRRKCVRDTV